MSEPLLVVGSLAYDDIETASEKGEGLLGGSASHFSLAASLAGAIPRIVAVVGEDFAEEDLALLSALPADIEGVERASGETFRWGGVYKEDFSERKTLYTKLGVFENFQAKLPESYRKSETVFLANIHPALQWQVLEQVDHPVLLALDTMNLWIESCPADLKKVIAKVDLLFINDEEARLLSGDNNLVSAGRKLLDMGPSACLLKKGEHGVLLFLGEKVIPFPSFPLADPRDPTGAGDSFAGGVMGFLAREPRLEESCLRPAVLAGSVLGSMAVEGLGVSGLQRKSQAEFRHRLRQFTELLAL
ncbi:MAG: PfkB family carbohydrate kinase [Candidatus Krumholzibacteria bacterium]|jgi:sugar/nucleoside kinase (ribokinase family)|nr:PfkB family carbohydrate kinase [Candidatus Krumholzibacteria bacterium]MDP6669180.1 PfkB family carbohydrate kinase [Candidatus Krumholzibacteria bacterium]MDP6797567.1 PfkB family carbohydrate kinase [Candidatus Krumholzibacteria bacterium]MDP7021260.1 PfkB family carbohydrate kinase [Candidatus Krumholzibacteria bacterium]